MPIKFISWLFNPAERARRRAEQQRIAQENLADYKQLSSEEAAFCARFWSAQSEEDWRKQRAMFPLCPGCSCNQRVKIISYGLRRQLPPPWIQQDENFRGCKVGGAERFTCETCQKDFFGHKSARQNDVSKLEP